MGVYMIYADGAVVLRGYMVCGADDLLHPPTEAGLAAARAQAAEMNTRYRAEGREREERTARVPRAKTTGTKRKAASRARRALWTERYGANTNSNSQGSNDVSRGQD